MTGLRRLSFIALTIAGLSCLDTGTSSPGFNLFSEANAIIGRPLTPMSYAGVARRTAYRGAVYHDAAWGAAAVATTAVVVAANDATVASSEPVLEVGTVVTTLPDGCYSTIVNGVNYQKCGGVYYRPAYQGNNLVYVVSAP